MSAPRRRLTWLRYARPEDVPAYEAAGWVVEPVNLGPGHGKWSVLLRWAGEGEPT